MQQEDNIVKLSIDLIIPNPNQPRKQFNTIALEEMASSIKEYGILNPILVRKKDNLYEIIAGERRYRAARLAGLTEVPVIIKNIDESQVTELALIENIQRENISPIEEAKSYEKILKLNNITEKKLSEQIGKSQSFISNKLRLLSLPENIQEALIYKKISERHARSLMTVNDPLKQQELLERIIKEKLTVKDLDNIINDKKITETEIETAINDIMKSLSIDSDTTENKKEEKESDNMNNGNFFPNFNPNNGQNGNVSLNTMNMQAMPSVGSAEINNPNAEVMPSVQPSPIPNFGVANSSSVQANVPQMPQMIEPTIEPVNTQATSPIPNFGINMSDTSSTISQPVVQNNEMGNTVIGTSQNIEPIQDIPLFSEPSLSQNINVAPTTDFSQNTISSTEMQTQSSINAQETQSASMIDTPLFGGPELQTMAQPVETSFEVPVAVTPPAESQLSPSDKYTILTDFLNSNGINYKSYSNETGKCIIIEM